MSHLETDIQALRDLILRGLRPEEYSDAMLVPDGYTIQSLERFQIAPARLRGVFQTQLLDEFLGYLADQGNSETAVFVDLKAMRATARLDHGNHQEPGWGAHCAVLDLLPTPEYTALLGLCRDGSTASQDALADWLVDWADYLELSTAPPNEADWEPMPLPAALQAVRKLESKTTKELQTQVGDIARARTAMEQAAITNTPPRALRFTCKPYEELGSHTITARLAYLPQDPPRINVRLLQHQILIGTLGQEFIAALRGTGSLAAAPHRIHLGTFTPTKP